MYSKVQHIKNKCVIVKGMYCIDMPQLLSTQVCVWEKIVYLGYLKKIIIVAYFTGPKSSKKKKKGHMTLKCNFNSVVFPENNIRPGQSKVSPNTPLTPSRQKPDFQFLQLMSLGARSSTDLQDGHCKLCLTWSERFLSTIPSLNKRTITTTTEFKDGAPKYPSVQNFRRSIQIELGKQVLSTWPKINYQMSLSYISQPQAICVPLNYFLSIGLSQMMF